MIIQEAIKSMKRFRRHGKFQWYTGDGGQILLCRADIIADDWEIESEKFEVTEAQLRAAWFKVINKSIFNDPFKLFLSHLKDKDNV